MSESHVSPKSRGTFAALRHRNFRYFWFGQCISLMGTWMQRAAQIWLVYTLTNSPFLLGLLGAAQAVPLLVFSLFAGAIVDRLPKRRLIIATQTVMLLQAFALALLTWSGRVRYWHVLALAVVLGITQTLDMPGRQSFFVEMVGKEDLMNAISLNSTIVNLAKIVGPTLAGIAMEKVGPAWCFFMNGVSFIAVIWGLFLIDVGDSKLERKDANVFRDVKEGLSYIWNSDALRTTAIILCIFAVFSMNINVIIPVFASDALHAGARTYAALMAVSGAGALIGALYMATMASKEGRRIKRIWLLRSAFTCSAVQMLMIFVRNTALALIGVGVIGYINLTFNNMANSTLQVNSTDRYRGRVMSVYSLVQNGMTPFGNIFVGTVMQKMGGGAGFFACGLANAVCMGILVILNPRAFRQPSRSPVPSAADGER